jgi:hypothetical protein
MILRPFNFIQWFMLSVISMTLTTYFNVSFFSTITIDVDQGLKYLILLILFENITSYCLLKQSLAKNTFVLDFLKYFQTKLNQRILSTDWIKIKLSDQVEIQRKIDDASNSVGYLIEDLINQLKEISKFLMTIITIFYICPIATILIVMVYLCFYQFYLKKENAHLLDLKIKIIEKNDKLYSKDSRVNSNMLFIMKKIKLSTLKMN